jgi:flagellar export protein FliJ
MAFQFRFTALLRYKEHLLTKAKLDLAAAVQEHESTKKLLEDTKEEKKRQRLVLEEKQKDGISSVEYLLHLDYLAYLERQLLNISEQLLSLSQKVEHAREALLLRQKDTKMLEIIREKDKREYRKALDKKELKQVDEKVTIASSHKKTSSQSNSQEPTDGPA